MEKRILIIFFWGLILVACNNKARYNAQTNRKDTTIPSNAASTKNSNRLDSLPKLKALPDDTTNSVEDWKSFQDSIRKIILSNKKNETLKNSILQEAYIKNIVWLRNDTLFFSIPFDLHGFDCGAPDCYSTDLIFNFRCKDSLNFPQQLPYTLHEHGCVKKEINSSGIFRLMELDKNFITYHSDANKSTLVIFKTDARGEFIYYFAGVGPQSITGRSVHKIIDDHDEENTKSIVPYRSTIMRMNEYEYFLEKKTFVQ